MSEANAAAKETHGDPYCLPPFNEHSCPKCMAAALAKAEAERAELAAYADKADAALVSRYAEIVAGKDKLDAALARAAALEKDLSVADTHIDNKNRQIADLQKRLDAVVMECIYSHAAPRGHYVPSSLSKCCPATAEERKRSDPEHLARKRKP